MSDGWDGVRPKAPMGTYTSRGFDMPAVPLAMPIVKTVIPRFRGGSTLEPVSTRNTTTPPRSSREARLVG
jgi:hypothetical protein